MTKSIWVPSSELKVTISGGKVSVWDEMTMHEKPLSSKPAGFVPAPKADEREGA